MQVSPHALPSDDEAFDAYIDARQFNSITDFGVMQQFLIRAARRYHALRAEWLAALDADDDIPFAMSDVKCRAYEFCCDQFENVTSDLRMFFSETDGFWDLSPAERSRLYAIADALVCSAKDVAKIDQAERLIDEKGGK